MIDCAVDAVHHLRAYPLDSEEYLQYGYLRESAHFQEWVGDLEHKGLRQALQAFLQGAIPRMADSTPVVREEKPAPLTHQSVYSVCLAAAVDAMRSRPTVRPDLTGLGIPSLPQEEQDTPLPVENAPRRRRRGE